MKMKAERIEFLSPIIRAFVELPQELLDATLETIEAATAAA